MRRGIIGSTEVQARIKEKPLKVNVRLFASYRDKAGRGQVELELPEGAHVSQAIQQIADCFPGVTADPSRLVVAVNQEYVEHNSVLHEGDEVALIPPVSGGCHDSPDA